MCKGPGLFTDIGKKAKDVLTANYTTNQKFSVNACSEKGVMLTSTALNKGGVSAGDVAVKFMYKNAIFYAKLDTDSKVFTALTLDGIIPSTKAVASLKFPDYDTGKLEVQYFHHYGTVATGVSLKKDPTIDVSATVGTPTIAFGAEAGYDTKSRDFLKYNAGVTLSKPDSCTSIILGDKGDSIRASYLHFFDKSKKSAAVGEVTRKLSTKENTVTIGGSYAVNPLTTVKARINHNGSLGALLQHELIPKSLLTISSEVDTKSLNKTPKLGLSISLAP